MSNRSHDEEKPDSIRIDKWLYYTRLFKTRALAAKIVLKGHVRINSRCVNKPGTCVRVNDVLTVPVQKDVVVVKVRELGVRRGPATEAQTLYVRIDEHS